MHQHVPLGSLGSPGLSLPYDQVGSRSRNDLPWPSRPSERSAPRPRRGLLRRVPQPLRLVPGTTR